MGYLPETMRNYLLRLGWSHGDDEIISTAQAIEWFNLESIGKSAARMDYKKLDNLNGHYIRETAETTCWWRKSPPSWRARRRRASCRMTARERLEAAMPSLKERAKTLVELIQGAEFLFTDGPRTLDAAADKLLTPEGRAASGRRPARAGGHRLDRRRPWKPPPATFAESPGLKLGQVAQPLRAALTGKASSPPLVRDVGAVRPGRIP